MNDAIPYEHTCLSQYIQCNTVRKPSLWNYVKCRRNRESTKIYKLIFKSLNQLPALTFTLTTKPTSNRLQIHGTQVQQGVSSTSTPCCRIAFSSHTAHVIYYIFLTRWAVHKMHGVWRLRAFCRTINCLSWILGLNVVCFWLLQRHFGPPMGLLWNESDYFALLNRAE